MTLILCHSPKGGVGTTFLTAQIAMGMAERGHDVLAIDFTWQDSLKLFFGIAPSQELPRLGEASDDEMVVGGIALLSGHAASTGETFTHALRPGQPSPFDDNRVVIADLSSADRRLKALLMPHAALHICAMLPRPGSLVALAKVDPEVPTVDLPRTAFILNQVDDTRKLSRHTKLFLGELFGDRLIGAVRRDEEVNEALASFQPIARYAPHSAALGDLKLLAAAVERACGLHNPGASA